MSPSNPKMLDWAIPDNLDTIIADEGMWESDHWQPVIFTVMGDTVYQGRPIAQAWQIEFSPRGPEFSEANKRLAAAGKTPDAYGWRDFIVEAMADHAPDHAGGLHTDDTEAASLVIWVESEEACKALMEVIWEALHP
ncbi:hypothetical protein GAO09_15450 [Rhizobiales bacterium RZME27]|uniref:Uncharacterized protein n=1 Tax=Endobacterium cereale TaxID=2663029 RepID=A0A6A8A9P0_9HYPH|nr:hypothetical protein [Endobacterium cereale]MEB2847156.1 hypothetical protein [Endobacterium cereale]MQY47429.1 hypothetical protein [Endobacterium cereale]